MLSTTTPFYNNSHSLRVTTRIYILGLFTEVVDHQPTKYDKTCGSSAVSLLVSYDSNTLLQPECYRVESYTRRPPSRQPPESITEPQPTTAELTAARLPRAESCRAEPTIAEPNGTDCPEPTATRVL
ncbi:uncharacterized protein [Musca autumnalis]